MPASSARSCSRLSRISSGDGGSATKRSNGIDADVMEKDALPGRRSGAREVERAQAAGRQLRADELDHRRVGDLGRIGDGSCERRDVARRIGAQRLGHRADRFGLDCRLIALQIDDDVDLALRIDEPERLESSVRARAMLS